MNSEIEALHDKLVRKEISARELADLYFGVIAKKDSEIHAFLDVWQSSACQTARAVDKKITAGEPIMPLEGIPLAVKDNILIKGGRATAGSRTLSAYVATYDAHVIEKLRRAGVIFLGKTNLDEFAMGSSTENSAFGATKNPHEASRVPGGSSGGSAAAIAAGMTPLALGSDTGGSIRQPASFCGVVGFKPSYGRVSRRGLIAMASSLDQIGAFANTVRDAEILFQAIEGKDPLDQTSVEVSEEVSDKKDIIVGIPDEFFGDGLEKSVEKTIREAFQKAETRGIRFEHISLPNVSYALACYYIIMPAEVSSNLARFDGVRYGTREGGETLFDVYSRTRERGFGREVKRRIAIGTYVLSHGYYDAYYLQAQRVRTLITQDFEDAFKKVDVIATPVAPTLPFRFGEKTSDPLSMYFEDVYTVPVNLAGLPGISIPAGKVGNLPVGLQLIGKRFADYGLLGAAKRFEEILKN